MLQEYLNKDVLKNIELSEEVVGIAWIVQTGDGQVDDVKRNLASIRHSIRY